MPRAIGSTINDATVGTIGGSTGSTFNDAIGCAINGTIGSAFDDTIGGSSGGAFIGPAKSGTRDGGGELVGIGDVGDERLCRRQLGDDGRRAFLGRGTDENVVVPAQNLRHRAADSTGRPGDQGNGSTTRALRQRPGGIHGLTVRADHSGRAVRALRRGIRTHAYFTGFGAALPAWSMGVSCRKSMLTCAGRVATKVITSATSWAVSDSTPW